MIKFEKGYFVSEEGIIFSNKGKGGSLRELIGAVRDHGYREVLITIDGIRKYKLVHRIVAETFIPNPESKRTVNHKDLNKLNNKVGNLEWMTDSENLIHARDLYALSTCKIAIDIARKIRLDTRPIKELCKVYGLKKTQIGLIKQNKRWSE